MPQERQTSADVPVLTHACLLLCCMQVYILAMHQWVVAGQHRQRGSVWGAAACCVHAVQALALIWLMPVVVAWAAWMGAASVWKQESGCKQSAVVLQLAQPVGQVSVVLGRRCLRLVTFHSCASVKAGLRATLDFASDTCCATPS